MKTKIVMIIIGLAAIIGWLLPSQSKEQLRQLEKLDIQLQNIKAGNDRLENTLQEYINRPIKTSKILQGEASIYSIDGCLGCDPDRIMANGEKLDDTRATIALPCHWESKRCRLDFGLNTTVQIVNVATGRGVVAQVTDTFGGIKGRVADLSLATAATIGCNGLCQVMIY